MEPEVVVKSCVRNFTNVVYREVILKSGYSDFFLFVVLK